MRLTTGLLLTAALTLPGAAHAQYGGPGSPYDPYGLRPGVGGIPGLPSTPGTRYVAPSRFQPWAGGIPDPGMPNIPGVPDVLRRYGVGAPAGDPGMPNIPGVPDGFGPIGPGGIPGLPRSPYDRYGLDPSIGDPLGRRFGVQYPPGNTGFQAMPDIRNLPQVTPLPPPTFDFKPDFHVTPSLSSSSAAAPLSGELLGWAAGFLGFVFLAAFGVGFLGGRRRA